MHTNETEIVDTGEARDGRGRKLSAQARREELVRANRASDLTMAAVARREGVKYATFAGESARAVGLSVDGRDLTPRAPARRTRTARG
jgi:hypothetical protein